MLSKKEGETKLKILCFKWNFKGMIEVKFASFDLL